MDTQEIWRKHREEVYFFILKKAKNKTAAKDIFQNTFFKAHKNLHQLESPGKVRAWIFQIVRNELNDYFKRENKYVVHLESEKTAVAEEYQDICCFDRFIEELPSHYKAVIDLVYFKGKTQTETARELNISLPNVKARIRRTKDYLKQRFNECCKYKIDENGQLTGEPDCTACMNF
ncbi:RNA polymerase sigma (SigZ) subunit [Salegentibacter sp. 24]|uniref:sigma-70 family RNA polymerase sigma factor n=1 Tax=Salegentibacter sp. 24 TaxID=2183986 RepID=UPI0010600F10|nr:sigma-70 family RNA polymerase sigma factor [Salegentibacter sp. 24]TDN83499.1 RNA polymerase sigma (SigZ) subunit [Salegentibacter sp. 24]